MDAARPSVVFLDVGDTLLSAHPSWAAVYLRVLHAHGVAVDEPTFTGCHVWARPIGGLEMRDEMGFDFKTLCVALGDPHQQHIERLDQMRPHRLVEIEHFFNTYKLLEEKEVDVVGWRDQDRAREVLLEDRERYKREQGG